MIKNNTNFVGYIKFIYYVDVIFPMTFILYLK